MSFDDEMRQMRRQGAIAYPGPFVDHMERKTYQEARFRKKVEDDLLGHIREHRKWEQDELELEYPDPSEEDRVVLSICEAWLIDNGYAFRKVTEEEDSKETIRIFITIE